MGRLCSIVALALSVWTCAEAPAPSLPEASKVHVDLPPKRVLLQPTIADRAEEEAAPAPPATDIFWFDLETSSVPWRVLASGRVTDRDAYDNQPTFETGGRRILFTSMRGDQTDIFGYQVDRGSVERLTETLESEYSPTPIPGAEGFSTVRVEGDGTQRLWRFSPSLGAEPELVFAGIEPVGYHAWIDAETVAMFVLDEPHRLVIGDVSTQQSQTVASGIGRALHQVPGKNEVSFVDKTDPDHWFVSILDVATGSVRKVAETPAGSEDFIWWSEREILIASGSKLYLFIVGASEAWREVLDLADSGIRGTTRMSRSPLSERLALVGERDPG